MSSVIAGAVIALVLVVLVAGFGPELRSEWEYRRWRRERRQR